MKKMFLNLLLALMLVLAVVPAMAEANDEPYTISYICSRSETDALTMAIKDVVALYQETHPNFKMDIECISDRTAYLQKIKILAASDELPAWFDSDPDTFFASLVDAGYVADMEALYEELGVADKFFNISKEYARLADGRLNLFTLECNTEYFFYNKEIFAAAGIEALPTTMDELVAVCDKLVAAGYTPFTMGDVWPIFRYFAMVPFRMSGNDFIEQASAGKISWGSEVGIEGAKWMQKLATYFPEGWTTIDYDTMINLFTSGQAAMMYNGTWVTQNVSDENGQLLPQFDTFNMPMFSENDATGPSDYFANSGIGTAVNVKNTDAQMKDFLKFFFETYPDVAINKHNKLPSIMPSNPESLAPIYQKIMQDAAAVGTYAKCWDVVIDSASLETLNSATSDLALGAITPEEWAAQLDAAIAENVL